MGDYIIHIRIVGQSQKKPLKLGLKGFHLISFESIKTLELKGSPWYLLSLYGDNSKNSQIKEK